MLLQFKKKGIYCAQADVYIDPWQPVKRALITHGHADHSRTGSQHYLATNQALPVIKHRLGDISAQGVDYNQSVNINGVSISFHPAGHIPGSAQIRLEYKGEIWVVSGDYKVESDSVSEPFEPVKCHTFITESTFGLPIYQWKPQKEVFDTINRWWRENKTNGKTTVLSAYALGKAQRIIHHLDESIGNIYTHGAVENVNEVLRTQGLHVKKTIRVTPDITKEEFKGSIVITTPSSLSSPWVKRFGVQSTGICSGWMALRGARRRRAVDRGFILSDHADWNGLNEAVKATGAERVFVTHGYSAIFSKWLQEKGIHSQAVATEYEGESLDAKQEATET